MPFIAPGQHALDASHANNAGTSAIYGGVANIDNIDNFGDFGRYITGYLQYHVAGSEARTLPDNAMYINE